MEWWQTIAKPKKFSNRQIFSLGQAERSGFFFYIFKILLRYGRWGYIPASGGGKDILRDNAAPLSPNKTRIGQGRGKFFVSQAEG